MRRSAVVRLRDLNPTAHPWLGDRAVTPAAAVELRACPACGARLQSYAFGGGNTRVDACDACEHVFLDRGELAAIVREARDGIAMSEDARQQLHVQRVVTTWQRFSNAELAFALVAVAAVSVVAHLTLELERDLSAIGTIAVAAVGLFLFWRHQRNALREKNEASERLARLMDAEHHRLDGRSRRSSSKPSWSRAETCPFCKAPRSASSTHCATCDSDFGR